MLIGRISSGTCRLAESRASFDGEKLGVIKGLGFVPTLRKMVRFDSEEKMGLVKITVILIYLLFHSFGKRKNFSPSFIRSNKCKDSSFFLFSLNI